MKIIDARSGQEMTPGKTVVYGDGERLRVIDIDETFFQARALIESTTRDFSQLRPTADGILHTDGAPLVTQRQWVPLIVRWMHPQFLFQRVGFIPS